MGQLHEHVVDLPLLGQVVGLHLQVEAVREELRVLPGGFATLGHALAQQTTRHLPGQTRRQRDEPLAVARQQGLVHPRLVVEAMQMPGRHQLDQVLVARVVHGQQHQVVADPGQIAVAVGVVRGRDIDLAAQDGVDADILGGHVEGDRAEHVAMVGDGGGALAEVLGRVAQVLDADGAVEEAVLGVAVEMDEV